MGTCEFHWHEDLAKENAELSRKLEKEHSESLQNHHAWMSEATLHDDTKKKLESVKQELQAEFDRHTATVKKLDVALLQLSEAKKALEEIRHYEFSGDSMSPSGITADKALKGWSEKRNPVCVCRMDADEPSHKCPVHQGA